MPSIVQLFWFNASFEPNLRRGEGSNCSMEIYLFNLLSRRPRKKRKERRGCKTFKEMSPSTPSQASIILLSMFVNREKKQKNVPTVERKKKKTEKDVASKPEEVLRVHVPSVSRHATPNFNIAAERSMRAIGTYEILQGQVRSIGLTMICVSLILCERARQLVSCFCKTIHLPPRCCDASFRRLRQ